MADIFLILGSRSASLTLDAIPIGAEVYVKYPGFTGADPVAPSRATNMPSGCAGLLGDSQINNRNAIQVTFSNLSPDDQLSYNVIAGGSAAAGDIALVITNNGPNPTNNGLKAIIHMLHSVEA